MPDLALPTTARREVNFAHLSGRAVIYCYPWSGRPGVPDPPGWDAIPGAHGSTPETEGFRDLHIGFSQLRVAVFGLSTQSPAHQADFAQRIGVPFEIVSDEQLRFQRALDLPTFTVGGDIYLKRLTLAIKDGRIERVYYPVRLPHAHAREVLAWLAMLDTSQ
jgi:peroxiredoxin